MMKQVVFVSIEQTILRMTWNRDLSTDVFYSDFLSKSQVDSFIEQLKEDYPDSNLINKNYDAKIYIRYVVLTVDNKDTITFNNLKHMMRATKNYNDRKKYTGR